MGELVSTTVPLRFRARAVVNLHLRGGIDVNKGGKDVRGGGGVRREVDVSGGGMG